MSNLKIFEYGMRVCSTTGPYNSTLLKKWGRNWVFNKPTMIVGGGICKDTIHSMKQTAGVITNIIPGHTINDRVVEFKSIRENIFQGGTYIGVCNGAYIAGKEFLYDDYSGTRILHPGIGLLRTPILGPVYPQLSGSFINITDSFGRPHSMWYKNGGTFPQQIINEKVNYKVHAIYHDETFPAIVSFRYGKGTVVLSGIHPEYINDGSVKPYILFDHIFKSLELVI